jgi:hypothetical protein
LAVVMLSAFVVVAKLDTGESPAVIVPAVIELV